MATTVGDLERNLRSQILRRKINTNIRVLNFDLPADDSPYEIVCECGRETCVDRIRIPVHEYDSLAARPDCFLVIPGHEDPGVQEIIERRSWLIVRTLSSIPTSEQALL